MPEVIISKKYRRSIVEPQHKRAEQEEGGQARSANQHSQREPAPRRQCPVQRLWRGTGASHW